MTIPEPRAAARSSVGSTRTRDDTESSQGWETQENGWARYGWIVSAIWLIFLGYTIRAIFDADRGPVPTTIALALVVVFAGVYLTGFIFGNPLNPGAWAIGLNIAGLAIMLVIIMAMSTIIGLGALYMTPFVIAYSCFLLPRAGAWVVGLGSIAATLVLSALAGVVGEYVFIAAIGLGIFVLNMVTYALIDKGNKNEAVQNDLAVISERERVARDVHDVLGHTLTVVAVKAELAERLITDDPERSRAEIAEIRSLVRGALGDVRATVGGLLSNDLPNQLEALRITLNGAGIDVDIEGEADGQVPQGMHGPLGWLLREAGTNVMRHAQATHCRIRFAPGSLVIEDDGVGLGTSTAGNGVCGMSERMAQAGAGFRVGRADLGGTRVEASW